MGLASAKSSTLVFNGPLRAMRVIRYEALQFTSHPSNIAARGAGGDGDLGDTIPINKIYDVHPTKARKGENSPLNACATVRRMFSSPGVVHWQLSELTEPESLTLNVSSPDQRQQLGSVQPSFIEFSHDGNLDQILGS